MKLTDAPAIWVDIDGRVYVLTGRRFCWYQATGAVCDLGDYMSCGPAVRP